MKRINIKFNGLGYNDINQIYVIIKSQNETYKYKTYNGCLSICLEENKCYKLIANYMNETINNCFYVNGNDNYIFSFGNILNNIITLSLKDYYYNLPIERGKLILWQEQ